MNCLFLIFYFSDNFWFYIINEFYLVRCWIFLYSYKYIWTIFWHNKLGGNHLTLKSSMFSGWNQNYINLEFFSSGKVRPFYSTWWSLIYSSLNLGIWVVITAADLGIVWVLNTVLANLFGPCLPSLLLGTHLGYLLRWVHTDQYIIEFSMKLSHWFKIKTQILPKSVS